MKTYVIYQPYYGCNRTRQLEYLLKKGFKAIDTRIDQNGRNIWIFKATQNLVDALNDFIQNESVNKNITYLLGPNI